MGIETVLMTQEDEHSHQDYSDFKWNDESIQFAHQSCKCFCLFIPNVGMFREYAGCTTLFHTHKQNIPALVLNGVQMIIHLKLEYCMHITVLNVS